jgi:hypothetical protein
MSTHDPRTVESVFHTLLNPDADFVEAARSLGLTLAQFLVIAESPPVTEAIDALEKLGQLRARALLAVSSHAAIAALNRIATSEPETPTARETVRKAAAQILRMAAKAEAAEIPLRNAEGVAESSRRAEACAAEHDKQAASATARNPATHQEHSTHRAEGAIEPTDAVATNGVPEARAGAPPR